MLSLSCHFLGTDASRIIVAPSVKWIIYDFSCFHLLFLGSVELRSVLASLNIYPLYTDFCKQLLLWVNFGWWFSSQGFSLCDFDEERWHMLQNSLLFCLQQMTVRSCIGMIKCVLWQQAVQPVGVRKLKEREKERVLPQTSLHVCFKNCIAFPQSLLLPMLHYNLTSSDTFIIWHFSKVYGLFPEEKFTQWLSFRTGKTLVFSLLPTLNNRSASHYLLQLLNYTRPLWLFSFVFLP